MDRADAIAAVGELIARVPETRTVLGELLDRIDQTGRTPASVTLRAAPPVATALGELFSPRAVVAAGPGKVRIDLARARAGHPELEAILYGALDRSPRDLRGEQDALASSLTAALHAITTPNHLAAAAFLGAERADAAARRGECWRIATDRGAAVATAIAADVAAALGAALELDAPLRVANFAARVLGDSKALAPGTERARRLAHAAIAHVPAVAAEAAAGQPGSWPAVERAALDALGLIRDDAAITVHCAGPLVYAKGGQVFDHVARHAGLGDVATLTLQQLRGASLVSLEVERITVIENQTPFLDYLEAADLGRELVILSRGQASWAVVTLLRLCGRAAPVRLAADLDRSGVLILRSLARRAGVAIAPWHTDVITHRRFVALGRPCSEEERARTAQLAAVDDPGAVAHDLLCELAATGVWIEQERFAHLALIPTAGHPATSTEGV